MDEVTPFGEQNDLLWALRPNLWLEIDSALNAKKASPLSLREIRRGISAISARAGRRAKGGPWIDCSDGTLRIWSTENQRLAVGSQRTRSISLQSVTPDQSLSDASIEHETYRILRETSPKIAEALKSRLRDVRGLQLVLRAAIKQYGPRVCIVGAPDQVHVRLAALEARRCSIPSVYVPHAPAANNIQYSDIPADYALLGTRVDLDHYRSLGAASEQLAVIGDPLAEEVTPMTSGPKALVLATTADRPQSEFSDMLSTVVAALEDLPIELIVASHPRDRGVSGPISERSGVRTHRARTSSVFASNFVIGVVAERSSGVLLNAVRYGLPVARWSGGANYVFEVETVTALEQSPQGLRDFAVRALEKAEKSRSHDKPSLHDAGRWNHAVGVQAQANREQFLAQSLTPVGPVLDKWGFWSLQNKTTR